jgi:hypothetical protein
MAKTYKRIRKRYRNAIIPDQRALKCMFCGFPGALTLEHVFSRWTHRFLPPRSMKNYSAMHVDSHVDRSDRTLIVRPGDIRDWQIRCVCEKTCNNGWMREKVENPARAIMGRLIDGTDFLKGETTLIFPHQQRMIANWAVLKAMVAEFDPQSTVTTHYMQRRYFKDNLKPPAGWAVWIGPYLRGNWVTHWGSTPFQYFSRKQERRAGPDVRATYHNSHISTQVVGKLFIQVIRCPYRGFVERWKFATPDKGSLFRIWPPSETIINWPGQFMSDRDADYVAGAMFNFLMAGTAPLLEKAISAL